MVKTIRGLSTLSAAVLTLTPAERAAALMPGAKLSDEQRRRPALYT